MPLKRRVARRFAPLALVAAVAAALPATMAAGDGATTTLYDPALPVVDNRDFIDVGTAFDVTTNTVVTALAIEARFSAPARVTVEIREMTDTTPGDVIASAAVDMQGAEWAFREIPIAFEFLAGRRYDVRFRVPEFWSAQIRARSGWNYDDLQPSRYIERGAFRVLDGGGGATMLGGSYLYDYPYLPHIAVIGSTDKTAPAVEVRVGPNDHVARDDWYNLASSGSDGVNVEVEVTDESPVARVACDVDGTRTLETTRTLAAFDVLGDRHHVVACTAEDAHGNQATATLTLKIDQTPPSLEARVSPNPVREGQEATAVPRATDSLDVAPLAGCDDVPTDAPGRHQVDCWAEDVAGNRTTAVAEYEVLYAFDGFFSPVRMSGDNRAKAGSSVPLKFSLDGFRGLDVLADGSPEVRPCGAATPVTAARGALSYDTDADRYVYVWRTDRAWAGECREITVRLDDGSAKAVRFTLR